MSIILFVHQSAEMYGSDKVLQYLVGELLQRGQYEPVVILPETGPLHDALIADGIEVHIGEVAKISRAVMSPIGLVRLTGRMIKGVGEIDRIIAGRNVAVVHSNTLAVLSGAIWAARRRVKHLWHVHEIILSPKLVSKIFPLLVRLLSDRVMSNSSMTERWLLDEQPSLKARSGVVFNGLPPVQVPSAEHIAAFRSSVGASQNDIVITLAGRINRWKGQELLIEAATILHQRGLVHNLRFVIVGSPAPGLENLVTQLQQSVATAELSDRFTFIPFVDDIWPVWFGSDIGVVPSTEPEPFGMVAIEAMAANVPVIAAAHGGLLDIVENNKTGLLFEPKNASSLAEAIAQLTMDKNLRKIMGEAGGERQRAIFSLESQVSETERVYHELSTAAK